MFYLVLISILILIAVVAAAPYVFKELKKAAYFKQKVELFGSFSFTDDEWKYVYQKEFVEDERGRSFFNKYSGIISYGENIRGNVQQEIFFSSRDIYITDGKKGKSFAVNRLSYFETGVHLSSIRLLHLSPLKKLQIKVTVDMPDGDLSTNEIELEYLVPIPQASLEKIGEILTVYGKIILDS
ncbi:MAG: hypothetical protein ABIP06_12640 [Pyrinomonadaceae bacterium]